MEESRSGVESHLRSSPTAASFSATDLNWRLTLSFLRSCIFHFFLGTCILILGTLHSTGYVNMREVNAELFGEEVIGKTDEVYGLDAEGEIKGSYRPSGHPGVRCNITLP